ncbi:MAG: DNA translocase FtsK 4TM domain-containing protein, partial [Lactobacillus sp.]|nr:DNA translocase FtsK 4TM domain-containing protein [Lactobacillus sp.]
MARKKKKEKSLFSRVSWRVWGAVVVVFSLLLVISCLSYDVNDPSYHVVTSRKAQNILGYFGAFWASIFVPVVGFAIVPFLIAPIVWGYNKIRGRDVLFVYPRIFAFVLGMVFLAPVMSFVSRFVPTVFDWGGFVGVILLRKSIGA